MKMPKEVLAAARGGYYGSTDLEAIVYLLLNPNEYTIPNTMPRTKELDEVVNRMNRREASIAALLQVAKVDKDKWFNDSRHYGLSPVELVSIHELISIPGRYNAEARVGFIIRGVESAYEGEGIIEKANRILDELAPEPDYYLGTIAPNTNLRDLTTAGTYIATRGSDLPLILKEGTTTWVQLAEDFRRSKAEAENRPVVTAVQKSSDMSTIGNKLNDTEDQIREQEYLEQEYQEYLSDAYVHLSEDCVQDNWLSMEPYKRDFRRRIVAGSGKRKVCGITHRRADKRYSSKAGSFTERWLSDDIL